MKVLLLCLLFMTVLSHADEVVKEEPEIQENEETVEKFNRPRRPQPNHERVVNKKSYLKEFVLGVFAVAYFAYFFLGKKVNSGNVSE